MDDFASDLRASGDAVGDRTHPQRVHTVVAASAVGQESRRVDESRLLRASISARPHGWQAVCRLQWLHLRMTAFSSRAVTLSVSDGSVD
jgi:hypothetical protein